MFGQVLVGVGKVQRGVGWCRSWQVDECSDCVDLPGEVEDFAFLIEASREFGWELCGGDGLFIPVNRPPQFRSPCAVIGVCGVARDGAEVDLALADGDDQIDGVYLGE